MAAPVLSFFTNVSSNNGAIWTNTLSNDILLYSQSNSQRFMMGNCNTTVPSFIISSNMVSISNNLDVNGNINFKNGTIMSNGVLASFTQWSNNNATVFLLSSNVGIGSSNPVAPLHIYGTPPSGDTMIYMARPNGGDIGISFTQTGVSSFGITHLSGGGLGFFDNRFLGNGGTERMRINTVGAVGIGTTSPSTLLQMTSNTSNYVLYTNASNLQGVKIGIDEASSTTPGHAYIWNMSNSGIRLGTNNTEVMRITSNANVGIGINNPSSKLHVSGNTLLSGDVTISNNLFPTLYFQTGTNYHSLQANDGANTLFYSGSTAGHTFSISENPGCYRTTLSRYGAVLCGELNTFTSASNSGSVISYGRILGYSNALFYSNVSVYTSFSNFGPSVFQSNAIFNANVGINNTNPGYRLDVNGDINFTNGSLRSNGNIVSFGGGSSQWTSSGANVYVGTGSNVGIGTTTPSTYLQISGTPPTTEGTNLFITRPSGGDVTITLTQNGISSYGITHLSNAGGLGFFDNRYPGNSGTERMRINSAGNVGINNTNPGYRLDVNGDINFTNGSLRSNGNIVSFGGGSSQWTSSGSTIYITGSNVGIGTTPSYPLDVSGDIRTSGRLVYTPRIVTTYIYSFQNGTYLYNGVNADFTYLIFYNTNNPSGYFTVNTNTSGTNRMDNYIQLPSAGTYRIHAHLALDRGAYGRWGYTTNYSTFLTDVTTTPYSVTNGNSGVVHWYSAGGSATQSTFTDVYTTTTANDRLRFFVTPNTACYVASLAYASWYEGISKITVEWVA